VQTISKRPRLEQDAASERVLPRASRSTQAKTLVIGLGNPLVADDSVGLRVAACLEGRLEDYPNVDVVEDFWGGLRLMEKMIGYRRAIVIDAMFTGSAPGTILHATAVQFSTRKSASAHDVDLPTALAFGRAAGALLPADDEVRLVGIEAADLVHFGDCCTPDVAAAIPRAVAAVVDLLGDGQ
jgi:hydrogenase maturation protease